jgi:cardiolipin synthase
MMKLSKLPALIAGSIACSVILILAANLMPARRGTLDPLPHEFGTSDPQFLQTMASLTGGAAAGHRIDTLVNGDQIFPAMLEEINQARISINFETYIYWSGTIGQRFAEALAAKAKAGVQVRVLVDWAGSIPFDQNLIDIMAGAGVAFKRFRPIHWYTLDRLNNRTHRKILVVDGAVGFTGGVGIGDEWLGDARNEREWRDTHYRISGPVVQDMQAAFAAHWLEATGEVLQGERFFPVQQDSGRAITQLILSSTRQGSETMHLMMLMALAAAEQQIRMGMAYFVPDNLMIAQLVDARKRGVEIKVIVPGEVTDVPIVRNGSRYFWGELLRAGVRIYEYQGTMYHPKIIAIDDTWVTVGSANLDDRSLRLNDEANINVYDNDFATTQAMIFEADLSRSREVTLREWEARPITQKMTDWLASLFRSQI